MARLVYLDETGSVGKAAKEQPELKLVAAMVDEAQVQPLAASLRECAFEHLGWIPADFEFHGFEVWGGSGYWSEKQPSELTAAYKDVVNLLNKHDVAIAYATIHKQRLHDRYQGAADSNAYLLALQFLLEKLDRYLRDELKILIADETKEHQLRAITMVADLQEWGFGEVPGRQLVSIIDSMHFVSSHASHGVQLADMCAYALQRRRSGKDKHPEAVAAIREIAAVIDDHTRTWREVWP